MDTKALYTTKAEKYARYRWDYAPRAILAIWETAGLTAASTIADIGAGTGILTRHFARKVGMVFAVEPNPEMRQAAAQTLPVGPACQILDGCAEAIPLPDQSLDLITVAQAIHWFNPEPTRAEFLRILKPGGWLALVRNYGTDQRLNFAIGTLAVEENGVDLSLLGGLPEKRPVEYYYGSNGCRKMVFPISFEQDWEAFSGALLSASYMPGENHPCYQNLLASARGVFDRFSRNSGLEVRGETELIIGQPVAE